MVNAPEGFNQVFFLKHLLNGRKWILLRACYEMSFNSMMYHDEIHLWLQCWPTRQQQEQSGQIQYKSEKNGTNLTCGRNKADKFRINLKKAWWNDQKYDEIPKFREISPCSRPMLPFSSKVDVVSLPRLPIWQPFLVCFSTSISSQLSPPSIYIKERPNSPESCYLCNKVAKWLKLQRFHLWSKTFASIGLCIREKLLIGYKVVTVEAKIYVWRVTVCIYMLYLRSTRAWHIHMHLNCTVYCCTYKRNIANGNISSFHIPEVSTSGTRFAASLHFVGHFVLKHFC